MAGAFRLGVGTATVAQVALHLQECSAGFVPPLAERVDIAAYAAKLVGRALCFEAWDGAGRLAGLVAVYDNGDDGAFVSNVSVAPQARGQGVAKMLLRACLQRLGASSPRTVRLEVHRDNGPAIRLYEREGFRVASQSNEQMYMECATGPEGK